MPRSERQIVLVEQQLACSANFAQVPLHVGLACADDLSQVVEQFEYGQSLLGRPVCPAPPSAASHTCATISNILTGRTSKARLWTSTSRRDRQPSGVSWRLSARTPGRTIRQ